MKISPTSRKPWDLDTNEAMQFGKPVIATFDGVAVAHDLVGQEINGFIVSENNAQALAKAINKIEELAKKMEQKSREIILKLYTYDYMVKGFIEK